MIICALRRIARNAVVMKARRMPAPAMPASDGVVEGIVVQLRREVVLLLNDSAIS